MMVFVALLELQANEAQAKNVAITRSNFLRCARRVVPSRGIGYLDYVWQASMRYDVPVELSLAVIRTESAWYKTATSNKGASGLMQLMPSTASLLGVRKIYDPQDNISGGVKFLRLLANRFDGDMLLIVAGYNAGPGAVKKSKGVPRYKETRRYVRAVMKRFFHYRKTLAQCSLASQK